ncbi:MAG: hypothetical protein HKN81_10935, partial [Gammaproteobacteria bacterium]|nr:hypothetical protein [Gammaproteobacteria bacterium]
MKKWVGLAIVSVSLAACGGSGGGSPPPAQCPYNPDLTEDDSGCVNSQPIADAGTTATANAGEIVRLDARGSSDPDGSIDSYLWTQASGPAVTLGTPTSATASLIAPRVPVTTDLVFQVRVTDNFGAIATDIVIVRVSATTNRPPIADAGVDDIVSGGSGVVLDGRASTDPDAPLTDFRWEQIGGTPTVQLNADDQPTAEFIAPLTATATVLQFRLTVTDDFGEHSTDEVMIAVLATAFHNLSGTITAPPGVVGDSDTNDPLAPYAPNDAPDQAQPIPNPVTVGGFANTPGSGTPGRSTVIGDVNDYFAISLTAGTLISLTIAEPAIGDLDLYLFDESRNVVDSSAGLGQVESVDAPAAGDYFIAVRAFNGASNYTLVVGQAPLSIGPRAARLADDFVPGEVIVRMKPADRHEGAIPASTLTAQGLHLRATGLDGIALVELEPEMESRIPAGNGQGLSAALRFRDSVARRKWQTLMALKALSADPAIEFAEPNYLYQPFAIPNDSFYSFQWHYPLINLPAAWDLETGSSTVT